jgi:hypothetical protein
MNSYVPQSLTNLVEFFTDRTHKQSALKGDIDVDQMTEHAVSAIDPKIRVINRYGHKLQAPIAYTWDYLNRIADLIPVDMAIGKSAYANDARVRILFESQETMQALLRSVKPLMELSDIKRDTRPSHIYMLLCMEMKEHQFLGADLTGEIIRREVQKTSVDFSQQKVLSAGYDAAKAKLGFKKCAFDGLIHKVHSIILQSNDEYRDLIQQKMTLRHKTPARKNSSDLHNSFIDAFVGQRDYDGVGRSPELKEIERKLMEVRTKSASPGQHLLQAIEVFNHPEQYLKIDKRTIMVNRFGIKLRAGSTDSGVNLDYADVEIEDELKRIAIIASCPSEEIFPSISLLSSYSR